MATKLGKMANKLNEQFRMELADAVSDKFGIEVESNFNMLSMRLVTTRVDGQDFTKEQIDFIGAFSDGYAAAMGLVQSCA